jgi:hypothetical protein
MLQITETDLPLDSANTQFAVVALSFCANCYLRT